MRNQLRINVLTTGILMFVSCLLANGSRHAAARDKGPETKTHQTLESIFAFDKSGIPEQITFVNATGTLVDDGSESSHALRVQMDSAAHGYAGFAIRPAEPWDWSKHENFSVAFDIANQGAVSTQLYMDMEDGDGAVYTRCVSVPVGPARTYYAKMSGQDLDSADEANSNDFNFASGLRANPPAWDGYDDVLFISMWGKRQLNLSAMKRISFSVQSALRDKEITIDNIRLIANPAMDKQFLKHVADRYGQNAKVDFPGRVHDDAEMVAQRDAELAELNAFQFNAQLDPYSGWKSGPQLESTGFFRTEKVDGKWSLVTPEGHLYFATGIDIIRLSNSTTMTGYDFDPKLVDPRSTDETTPEDSKNPNGVRAAAIPSRHLVSQVRADMFEWLPTYDEPLGKHFDYRRTAHSGPLKRGETFSFYGANLERKYGSMGDYLEVWRDVTVKRMLDWGFTSLGNWTDPAYYDNGKIPFFANGWVIGDFKTVSSGNDFWAPMPDVFDPVFAERALATAKQVAAEVKGSPWCVGVFIDNEKSFGRSETNESRLGIVIHTLGRDGKEVPTKAEFTRLMREKYSNIEALNQAWDKSIRDWAEFDQGIDSMLTTDQQLADYSDLLFAYASKYFEVVDQALNKHMPNHLYLGSRLPDWGMPMEVIKACAKHADVISYNSYKEGLPTHKWEFLKDIDMPSIIGEFHFGASDSGLFHPGLLHAANQEDRARMYQEYMHSVIDNPWFVGAHWFQYIDSPITGRALDGENYNVGFVSVADVPYAPMVHAARNLHSKLYERRFGDQSTIK